MKEKSLRESESAAEKLRREMGVMVRALKRLGEDGGHGAGPQATDYYRAKSPWLV